MSLISQLFHYMEDTEYTALEEDEDYQSAKAVRNEAEKALIAAMSKKQRVLFHQYRDQQEALTSLELRRLLSRCSLILRVREK